jgi:para-aminobenzoate synthetase component 1
VTWNNILKQYKSEINKELPPFTGGLCGYLSYDLSKQIESIPRARDNTVPDYILGLYNQVFAFDHIKEQCFIMVNSSDGDDTEALLDSLLNLYNQATNTLVVNELLPLVNLKSNYTQTQYTEKVEAAKEYILNGDIFEVNLSQCFSARLQSDYPLNLLYKRLRSINQVPFGAYLNLGKVKILSASPERFLSIKDRHVETRPIKGTTSRSSDPVLDKQLIQRLQNSTKDRAENIMIVDLMRNDLSKICTLSSVVVSSLCEIESLSNLHHLVSVVEGDLKPDRSVLDIIPACFPGGSITGAPKIRAMQIIEDLEDSSRGVYCGCIGYFGFNGNVDLSIAIRTIVVNNDILSFNVGGAVTLDSDSLNEYNETLLKAQKLIEAVTV